MTVTPAPFKTRSRLIRTTRLPRPDHLHRQHWLPWSPPPWFDRVGSSVLPPSGRRHHGGGANPHHPSHDQIPTYLPQSDWYSSIWCQLTRDRDRCFSFIYSTLTLINPLRASHTPHLPPFHPAASPSTSKAAHLSSTCHQLDRTSSTPRWPPYIFSLCFPPHWHLLAMACLPRALSPARSVFYAMQQRACSPIITIICHIL